MKEMVPMVILMLVATVAGCDRTSTYDVSVGDTAVRLSAQDWKPMDNPEPYAENFEAQILRSGHAFPQVLTIFKLPMSEDRRIGIQISSIEFVEFFVVQPGKLTIQIRVDRGKYWVLSRETFDANKAVSVNVNDYRPVLSEEENRILWNVYQNEVDATRTLINEFL